jgi:hypothetical protein
VCVAAAAKAKRDEVKDEAGEDSGSESEEIQVVTTKTKKRARPKPKPARKSLPAPPPPKKPKSKAVQETVDGDDTEEDPTYTGGEDESEEESDAEDEDVVDIHYFKNGEYCKCNPNNATLKTTCGVVMIDSNPNLPKDKKFYTNKKEPEKPQAGWFLVVFPKQNSIKEGNKFRVLSLSSFSTHIAHVSPHCTQTHAHANASVRAGGLDPAGRF